MSMSIPIPLLIPIYIYIDLYISNSDLSSEFLIWVSNCIFNITIYMSQGKLKLLMSKTDLIFPPRKIF